MNNPYHQDIAAIEARLHCLHLRAELYDLLLSYDVWEHHAHRFAETPLDLDAEDFDADEWNDVSMLAQRVLEADRRYFAVQSSAKYSIRKQ